MFKRLKQIWDVLRRQTPLDMAKAALAEHEKELLKAQEHVAFYAHEVNYRIERIGDLTQTIVRYEQTSQAEAPTAVQRQRNSRRAPVAVAA